MVNPTNKRRRVRVKSRRSPIDRLAGYVWIICESLCKTMQDMLGFSSVSKYDTKQLPTHNRLAFSQKSRKSHTKRKHAQPAPGMSQQGFVLDLREQSGESVDNSVGHTHDTSIKHSKAGHTVQKQSSIGIVNRLSIIMQSFSAVFLGAIELLRRSQLLLLKQAVVMQRSLKNICSRMHLLCPVLFTPVKSSSFIGKYPGFNFSIPRFGMPMVFKKSPKFVQNILSMMGALILSLTTLVYNVYSHNISRVRSLEHIEQKVSYSEQARTTRTKLRSTMKSAEQKIRKKKTDKPLSRWRLWLSRLFFTGLVLALLLGGIFFIWVASLEIPDSNIDDRLTAQSTKIYDETGTVLLHDVYKDERRTVVSLSEISDNMKKAIMATEDDEFYDHRGYDISAILRGVCYEVSAVLNMRTFGGMCPRGGGSTITQQVIKNTLLNDDRKLERKIKEVVLARKLEGQKTKDEILEIYLNEIAFGGPIYGVEQASLSYFNKPASELTIAESAYLAALPKAPTTYLNNRAKFDGRQQFILGRMRKLGYISQQEYQDALDEEVVFVKKVDKGIKAPHFVFYVLDEFNKTQEENADDLNYNGYNIRTTLNWELQSRLEEVASSSAKRISEKYKASNVALVVIENKTGKIRAMIGSKDYFAEDIDGKFNVAAALRQPGSTFKPFVYANAFNKGYLPETIVWDTNTEFSTSCYPDGEPQLPQYRDRCYNPQNFDKRYRGPVSLRNALAQSLNIPAVKLLYLVGVSDSMNFAKQLGISSLNRAPSFYGLNLVLGGGEVRLVDMVSAYSVFGNGGVRHASAVWEEITDADEQIVAQYQDSSERVVSEQTAAMISQVLSDDDAKRPMFGSNSPLYYGAKDVAVKTGTTNNFRDVWTIGYTSDVTVGVWAGNNDNTPLSQSPSSSVVGPFWREAMDVALEFYSAKSFPNYSKDIEGLVPILTGDYEGGGIVYIDPTTSEIVENPTPEELAAGLYVPQGTVEYHSILHYINKKNPRDGQTSNPRSDSLYEHFEHGVQQWTTDKGWAQKIASSTIDSLLEQIAAEQGLDVGDSSQSSGTDDASTEQVPLDFKVKAPTGAVEAGERITISIDVTGDRSDIDTLYYYINNSYIESGTYRKTSIRVTPSSVRSLAASNTVKVVAQTKDGRKLERTTTLQIAQ